MAYDRVSININAMINKLSPIQPERCICKVPNYLRKVDEKAYKPQQLAIGPYYRDDDHLKAMEEHKLRYLQKLLETERINDVSTYVKAMKKLEKRARSCYTDPVNLESDDFVQMMLLDGCFIVQLFRMWFDDSLRVANDPIFMVNGLCFYLHCDLLLLENQIPFFVVLKLLRMIGISDKKDFTIKILELFKYALRGLRVFEDGVKSTSGIRHLLDLIHKHWRPSPTEIKAYRKTRKTKGIKFTRCATELTEAGIKFEKVEGASLFDIKFEKGTLKIPTLKIEDDTNYLLRNLIALEQLSLRGGINHITDYAIFMDCLINSAKDVEILTQCGIFDNRLGDDEAAASMFNGLRDSVMYSSSTYCYRGVSDNVIAYCRRRRNRWLANLNHNYFNSPWALISILAAAVILLLTLLQTIFSGIAL